MGDQRPRERKRLGGGLAPPDAVAGADQGAQRGGQRVGIHVRRVSCLSFLGMGWSMLAFARRRYLRMPMVDFACCEISLPARPGGLSSAPAKARFRKR
ncbi:hypothetical protein D3C85_1135430 [compost metagenome]